ncbi:NAD(P)-binding protein [Hyaloscypha variabilis F]|uniref:NAD(P)-binding protein n=1 Tax=Hyaloscypha variabilis (strain UAMH 11265 / GT02V1 / F) TaxID=1149755 RepID=A0A2J6RTH0_HYAVF|nr:NAD(P)-binding protein [Hyaloscypha variabilis F]
MPTTMQSWQYTSTKTGLENNLTLAIVPMPQPKPGQHLVRILSAALNPVDYRLSESPLLHRLLFPNPASPGDDFAGTIVVPAAGSSLRAGQRVFGAVGTIFMCGSSMSTYGIASTSNVVAMPAGLSMAEAAGITIAGGTAYQAIIPNSKPGDRVFLNGGSGGVGTFGIQIAKVAGRLVTVSCSGKNVELCKSLGADEVIDYQTQDVLETLKASPHRYDLVVDLVANNRALFWQAQEYTSIEAKFVTVSISHQLSFIWFVATAQLLPSFLSGAKRRHLTVFGSLKEEDLNQIAEWMVEGKVRAVIDSEYKFEDVREAYRQLKTGRAKGKIVVNVAPEEESKT